AGLQVLAVDDHPGPGLQAGEAVLYRHEQVDRRQYRALGIQTAILVAVAHILPELLGGLLDARQGEYLGVIGQIVEQRRGFLEEQRQVVLDARRGDAGAQVLVDGAAAEVDVEAFAEAAAKVRDRLLVQGELAAGQQADGVHL